MFGFLKKKLKEVVQKISRKDEHAELRESQQEQKTDQLDSIAEPEEEIKELMEERTEERKMDKVIEEISEKGQKTERPTQEIIEEDIEEKIEQLDEIERKEELVKEVSEELKKKYIELEKIKEESEYIPEEIESIKQEKEDLDIFEKDIVKKKETIEEEIKEKKELMKETADEKIKEVDEILEEQELVEDKKLEKEKELLIIKEEARKKEIKIEKQRIEEKPKEEKKGFFGLVKKVTEKTLTEEDIRKVLDDLQDALLESDVAIEVVERICKDVENELKGKQVSRSKSDEIIGSALRRSMLDVLQQERTDIEDMIEKKDGPLVIIFLGFNGVGKTTTLAKFAHKFKKYNPILAAGDTFRAASIEQLEEHGKNLGLHVVKQRYGADSAAVIFDARKHAEATDTKLVLADTAGRAHTNANLMDELKKVCRVNKPDLKILVLDSLTGNDIYEQARLFDNAVGVDAIILSKADVYEKGGSALSAAYTIKKPILYMGVGQEYDDLKEFNPEEIVKNLLG